MSGVDLHVSVVNTANRDLLERCLATLPDACEGLQWAATVVDNASGDGSSDLVRTAAPWATLIENRRRHGFTVNHNKVLRSVVGDDSARYVAILNEDTELERGSFARLVALCDADPGIGAAGPTIQLPDGLRRESYYPFPSLLRIFVNYVLRLRVGLEARSDGWLSGACVVFRTDALREIGLLDERFFIFFEDTDIGLRLHQAGWRSAFCPDAAIIHHEHQTIDRPGSRMDYQMLRSRFLYFQKHTDRLRTHAAVSLIRIWLLENALKACLGGRPGNAREYLRLFRYDPARVLPHEVDVASESPAAQDAAEHADATAETRH